MKVRIGVGLGTGAAGELGADGFWSIVDRCEADGWDSIWFSEKITGGIADPLAAAGLSIFAISTYDTDYVLVKARQLNPALEALRQAGHQITQ